jgi:hypothetical protein
MLHNPAMTGATHDRGPCAISVPLATVPDKQPQYLTVSQIARSDAATPSHLAPYKRGSSIKTSTGLQSGGLTAGATFSTGNGRTELPSCA